MIKGERNYKLALIKIFFVQVLISIDFILPIRVLYMINYGISNSDIGVLRTVYSILVTVLEIPTGVISDKISKKFSIVLSAVTFTLHAVVYILFTTFTGFILTQMLLALSAALASGTISAYVHDLVTENKDNTYTEIAGNLNFAKNIASVILVSVSSFFFFFNNKSNFLLLTVMGLVGTAIACRLPGTEGEGQKEKLLRIDMQEYLKHIVVNAQYLFGHSWLLKIIILQSINITFLIFNFDYYQILLKNIGFNMKYVGPLYASFFFWTGLGAKLTNSLEQRLKYKNLTQLYMTMLALSYWIMSKSNCFQFILVAIVLQQMCFGSWNLLVEASVLDNAASSDAKVILESLHNCLLNLIKAVLVLGLSVLMYISDLRFVYNVLSIIMIIMIFYQLRDNL